MKSTSEKSRPDPSGSILFPKSIRPKNTGGTKEAKFRDLDLQAVWSEYPECPLNGRRDCEMHHIYGRGYNEGYRGGDCKLFSSVFNSFPLTQDIHKGPYRDSPEMRALMLRITAEHVQNAIAIGDYVMREEDSLFLDFLYEQENTMTRDRT